MSDMNEVELIKAARNEAVEAFTLENPKKGTSKTFELKHLEYDDYVEFCQLARPILTVLSNGLDMGSANGEFQLNFNPLALDLEKLVAIAGKELPKMAWLCCKQSEPKITVAEVKSLGYRPQNLLLVVLKQIQHNQMIQEFANFFPQMVALLTALIPEAKEAVAPVATSESTPPTE